MRILFFGTPDLAVPSLERLIASRFDVVCVVSQPDRKRGRGRKTSPSPVAEVALRENIPLIRPEKVGESLDELAAFDADIGVVIAFGQFIPKPIRELPKCGFLINAHASLLPKHRGAAPIQAAILAGDEKTGVTVMRVEREMDAGAMALTKELEIGEQENAAELSVRMADAAAQALLEALEAFERGELTWTQQDHSAKTEAGKFDRETARIDWNESAVTVQRQVRAFAPKPGAFTSLEGETLRILAAHVDETGDARATAETQVPAPGTVECDGRAKLRVATGEGWLVLDRIQRAGGKPLEVAAFLRGRAIPDGIVLSEAGSNANETNAPGAQHG